CRIICEGAADRSFFNALISSRGITNCEAECAIQDNEERCGGLNAIPDTLRGLKGFAESQPNKLRGVVIAVDTDQDPKARLDETIELIKSAGLRWPAKYLDIKERKKPDEFSVAILGIPWLDKQGNLDSLLFDSLQQTHADIMTPLTAFCAGTVARNG